MYRRTRRYNRVVESMRKWFGKNKGYLKPALKWILGIPAAAVLAFIGWKLLATVGSDQTVAAHGPLAASVQDMQDTVVLTGKIRWLEDNAVELDSTAEAKGSFAFAGLLPPHCAEAYVESSDHELQVIAIDESDFRLERARQSGKTYALQEALLQDKPRYYVYGDYGGPPVPFYIPGPTPLYVQGGAGKKVWIKKALDASRTEVRIALAQAEVSGPKAASFTLPPPDKLRLSAVYLAPSQASADMPAFAEFFWKGEQRDQALPLPLEGFKVTLKREPTFEQAKEKLGIQWDKDLKSFDPTTRGRIQLRAAEVCAAVKDMPHSDIGFGGVYYEVNGKRYPLTGPLVLPLSEVAGREIRIGLNTTAEGIPAVYGSQKVYIGFIAPTR